MATQALGRGLGSLIPQKISINTVIADEKNSTADIFISLIDVNPYQPRKNFDQEALKELADSVKNYGVIQPIVVSKSGNRYEIIAGERRYRASILAGLKTIPAIVREAGEQEKLELALVENIQRENLDPIELALSYKRLIEEFDLAHEEMAKKVGKSRPTITNTMRLLQLPEFIQDDIKSNLISLRHAILLLGIESPEKQRQIWEEIKKNNLSVEGATNAANKIGGTKNKRIITDSYDLNREHKVNIFFKTKSKIKRNSRGGGTITIAFKNQEQLDGIVEKITAHA